MATALARVQDVPAFLTAPPEIAPTKRGDDPFVALLAHYKAMEAWGHTEEDRTDIADPDWSMDYVWPLVCQVGMQISRMPGRTALAAYAKLYVGVRRQDYDGEYQDSISARSAFDALASALKLPGYRACKVRIAKGRQLPVEG